MTSAQSWMVEVRLIRRTMEGCYRYCYCYSHCHPVTLSDDHRDAPEHQGTCGHHAQMIRKVLRRCTCWYIADLFAGSFDKVYQGEYGGQPQLHRRCRAVEPHMSLRNLR